MFSSRSSTRQKSWDAGRFLKTLNYFGELPFIGSFRWAQQMLGQRVSIPGQMMTALERRVVVIGDLPSEHLNQLKERLLSSATVIVVNPDTLFSDVKSLIRSVDTVVLFGSKAFEFLNENTESLAEVLSAATVEQLVFDFSSSSSDLSVWGALDDVVMGGVSEGGFALRSLADDKVAQHAAFVGNVSTDNSGGFSSVRTKNFEPPFNFLGWTGMSLRVKGDAQRYKFILRDSGGWDSPAYIYSFDTIVDEWQDVYIPFKAMVPTFRAKSMPNAPELDPQKIFSFQLMLSKFEYDRKLNPNFSPGLFELAIANIGVYKPRKSVPLIVVVDSNTHEANVSLNSLSMDHQQVKVADLTDSNAWISAVSQALRER